jgi:hypothetical protein
LGINSCSLIVSAFFGMRRLAADRSAANGECSTDSPFDGQSTTTILTATAGSPARLGCGRIFHEV